MNFSEIICLIVSLSVVNAKAFPQSDRELAIATRLTEQAYYNQDAPDLLPYHNDGDKDNAKQETEGYGSRIDSIYDGLQKKTNSVFNPQPVLDNVKEHEKYGNKGDQLNGVKTLSTSVVSVLSNFLNALVDAPVNIVTSVVSGANVVLNRLGGKIVGLV